MSPATAYLVLPQDCVGVGEAAIYVVAAVGGAVVGVVLAEAVSAASPLPQTPTDKWSFAPKVKRADLEREIKKAGWTLKPGSGRGPHDVSSLRRKHSGCHCQSLDGSGSGFEAGSLNTTVRSPICSCPSTSRSSASSSLGDTSTYTYDRLSRLTGSVEPAVGATTYTYDPAGNRRTRVRAGTTTYTSDRADRITTAGGAALTVDASGNLAGRGADTFTYDTANRLTSATVAGTTETYAYDGDGVRASRRVGTGPAIRVVSDVNTGLPVTLDDGTRKYVWGLGLAYAVSGSSVEVYHTDRLGSVRAITDAAGAVTATYRTDEFGVPTATTGTSSQPFGFTGEPRDATGLTYLRARSYDPSLGRFLSRDTWPGRGDSPASLNRYAYVGNNPATYTDPSGLVGPGGRGGVGIGTKGKSKVLEPINLLPCDPERFFLGVGLLVGGSFRAAAGLAALGATGGASSIPSWIAITSGAASTVAGGRFIWTSYNCPSGFP